MRYLAVMDTFGAGGAERSNADTWLYLQSKGVDIQLVALQHREYGTEQELVKSGLNIIFLKQGNVFGHAKQLVKIIKEFQPDIVHSTLFKSNIRLRWAKVFGGKFYHLESLVNTTYNSSRIIDPGVTWFNLSAYWLLDTISINFLADHFHAVAHTVAHHYNRRLGVSLNKITVVPRGRNKNDDVGDPGNRAYYRKEFGLTPGQIMILTAGRQEYQKGHPRAINALGYAKNELGLDNFKYVLLGRQGTATSEIQKGIIDNGLEDHVVLPGHRYDVSKIMAAADMFLFSSLYEGIGGALIEAQAAGLPAICSDIPELRETGTPDSTVFVDSTQAAEFGNEIFKLASDEPLRKRMGEASIHSFSTRFEMAKIQQDMYEFFVSLSKKHSQNVY